MGKPEIKYKISTLALLAATPGLAIAGPQGGNVVAGAATISTPTPQGTVIDQGSAKAIINWQSFSIGSNEYVQFNQPDSSSISLNRVVGVDPSVILGNLAANGQVFLVNPNGILFGTGATLDVGGLVASTLDIDDDDFLNGNYIFTGAEKSVGNAVVNAGVIQARESGYVVLMGDRVENSGNVETKFGQIALLAGGEVTLDIGGDGLLSYSIDSASATELAGVENTGELIADGGRVILAGKVSDALVATAVNNSGLIQANGIEERNGEIYLTGSGDVYNSGIINASGETGGTVSIQGKRVAQQGEIHADGLVGDGGKISIKADEVIALTNGSNTTANAGTNGDGGEVIAYTEGAALLRDGALIEAKGGSESGDGGFVEVSGIQHVEINGTVDASATNGAAGTFLIDPTDINIVADADLTGAVPDLADANMDNVFENDTTGVNEIGVGVITGILDAGTSVTLQTTNGVDNSPNLGDITVDTIISTDITGGDGDATLTLQADNDIILNQDITNSTGTLNVDLQADGNVTFSAGADITTNGGSVSITADTDGSNSGETIMMASDSVISAGSGTIALNADDDIALGQLTTSNTVDIVTVNGAITDANGVTNNITGSTVTLTADSGVGSGDALETTAAVLDVSVGGTGDIDIVETDGVQLAGIDTADGSVSISAAGAITTSANITATDGDISITTTADGEVTLSNDVTATTSANNDDVSLTITAGGTGTLTQNATTSILADAGGDDANATVNLNGGTVILNGNVTAEIEDDTDLSGDKAAVNISAAAGGYSGTGAILATSLNDGFTDVTITTTNSGTLTVGGSVRAFVDDDGDSLVNIQGSGVANINAAVSTEAGDANGDDGDSTITISGSSVISNASGTMSALTNEDGDASISITSTDIATGVITIGGAVLADVNDNGDASVDINGTLTTNINANVTAVTGNGAGDSGNADIIFDGANVILDGTVAATVTTDGNATVNVGTSTNKVDSVAFGAAGAISSTVGGTGNATLSAFSNGAFNATGKSFNINDGITIDANGITTDALTSGNGLITLVGGTGAISTGAINADSVNFSTAAGSAAGITTAGIVTDNGDVIIGADGAVSIMDIGASNAINVSGSAITTGTLVSGNNIDVTADTGALAITSATTDDGAITLDATVGSITTGVLDIDRSAGSDGDAAITLTAGTMVDLNGNVTAVSGGDGNDATVMVTAGGVLTQAAGTTITADATDSNDEVATVSLTADSMTLNGAVVADSAGAMMNGSAISSITLTSNSTTMGSTIGALTSQISSGDGDASIAIDGTADVTLSGAVTASLADDDHSTNGLGARVSVIADGILNVNAAVSASAADDGNATVSLGDSGNRATSIAFGAAGAISSTVGGTGNATLSAFSNGAFNATGKSFNINDGITIDANGITTDALTSGNGLITLVGGTGAISTGAINADSVNFSTAAGSAAGITTAGIVTDNGDVIIDADGAVSTMDIGTSNAINVSGSAVTTGALDATDAGVDLTSTSGAISVGTISADSADGTNTSVTVNAATTLTVGDITVTSDAVDLSAGTTISLAEMTGASDISLSAEGTVTSSAATAYAADSISLLGTGAGASYLLNTDTAQLNLQGGINSLVLNNAAFNGTTSNIAVSGSGYGSLDIDTDVNTDVTGTLSATGIIDFNSATGDLTINNDVSTTSTLTLTGAAIDSSASTLSGDSGLTLTGDSIDAGALNADTGIITVTANTGNVATTAITANSISITANDATNGAITTGALTTDVGSISLVSEGDVSTGSNAVSSATTVNLDGANVTAGGVSGTTVTLDGASINVGSITSSAGLNVLNADDFTAGDIDSGGLGLTVNTTTSIDTQAITNTAAVALTSATIGTGDISGTTVLLDGTTIDTGAITASSGLSISNADDFTASGTINNGGLALSVNTNNSIDTQTITNSASVTLASDTVSTGDLTAASGNVAVTANDGAASTGGITANSGSVNVSATNGATTIVGNVSAGTNITLSGAGVNASANGDLTTASGNISVNVPTNDANGIVLGNLSAVSGTVSVDAVLGDTTVGDVAAMSGTVSGEDVVVGSVTGNIGVMASNLTLDGTYANGTFSAINTLTLDTTGIIENNDVSLSGADINIDGTINALAMGAEQNASVTLNATNHISITGTVNVSSQSGNATFIATADSDGDMSGDFTQTATGAVTVTASNTPLVIPMSESGTGNTNINIAGASVQQLGSLTSNAANGTSAILIPGTVEPFSPDLYLTTGSVANQSSINLTSTTGSVETNTITSNYLADTVFGAITGSESISIKSADAVTVSGAIQTSNTASTEMVSIMAAGNVAGAGSLASDSVSITTTGDIGSVSESLNIDASSVVISGSLSNAWLGLDRATSSLTLSSGVSDLLDVTAAGALNLDGTLTASDIVLDVAGNASDGGNVLTANSVSLNGTGDYGTTSARFDINAADINVDESVNSAVINSSAATTDLNFVNNGHGNIDVTGSSDLTVTSTTAISANTFTTNISGSLDLQQDLSTTTPLVLTANGITSGTNVLTASSISLNGTGTSNVDVDTNAATVVLGTGLADVDVDNGANTAATIFNFGAGSYGALTLNTGGDTSFTGSNITTSGDVNVMSSGTLAVNRNITVNTGADANLSLTASGMLTQQVGSSLTATAGSNAGDSATVTLSGSSVVQDGIVIAQGGGAGGTNTIDVDSTTGNIEASILLASSTNGNNALVDIDSAAGVTFDTFSAFGFGVIQALANSGNDATVNVTAATTITQNAGNNIRTAASGVSEIDISAGGAVQLDGIVDADNVAGTSTIDVTGSGYTGTAILDANSVAITTTGGAIDARTRSADITLAGTDTLTLDNTAFTGATTFNYTQSSYNTLDLSFGGTTTLVGSDITTSGATSISSLAGLNLNQGYSAPVINLTAGGQVNVAGLLNAATINFDGNGGANFGSSGSKIMTNAGTVDLGAGISDVFIDNEMNTGNATLNFSGTNYGIVDFDFGGNSASSGMGVTTTSNVTGNDFLASALAISGNGNINVTAGFDVNGGTVPGVEGDTLLTAAVASVSGIINDGGSSDPNASFIATDKLTLNVSNLKQSNQYVLAKADDIQFTGTSNAENLLVQLTPFSSGADILGNFKSLSFNQTASGAADFNYGFDEHFAPFTGTTIALGEQGFAGDLSVGLLNAGTKNLIFLTSGAISGLDNIIGTGLLGTADETGGFFVVRPIVTTFTADQLGSFGFKFGARVATIELNNGFDASGEDERNRDDLELEEGGVNDGSEQQCS